MAILLMIKYQLVVLLVFYTRLARSQLVTTVTVTFGCRPLIYTCIKNFNK